MEMSLAHELSATLCLHSNLHNSPLPFFLGPQALDHNKQVEKK